MNIEIKEKYDLWTAKATADEALIKELSDVSSDEDGIFDRFYTELKFGTAGLRGIIGAGTNRMNIYTVGRTTQGLADCINSKKSGGSVAISYDCRINSELFAKRAAQVLAANGIHVYITPVLEPTPVLSFMVRYFGCDAGIMITASHNPAQYNGYKCYGSDGCQMTDVYADETTAFVEKLEYFTEKTVDFEKGVAEGIIEYTDDTMLENYYKKVMERAIDPSICEKSGLSVIYSPLNGTGNIPVREILSRLNVKCDIVREQELPDGNFPTTPFPNPEFPKAFELGIKLADDTKSDIIIATDPDADRAGVAVRDKDGEYRLLTGNEMGCMMLYYILSRKSEMGILPENPMAVKSLVSSDLANKIAEKFSCRMVNVLTGFKYIGEQIKLLEEVGKEDEFQLGFEESYGYLSGSYVRDKDAVFAALMICEMAAYCKMNGKTLLDFMQEIYSEFGVFRHKTISASFDGEQGMNIMAGIMKSLRENPPKKVAGLSVLKISDHLTKETTEVSSGKVTPIDLPAADVFCMYLENDCSLIIRPSGTEPKIKAYMTACAPKLDEADGIVAELEKEANILFGK
ncbi:MAG: phospho-sugar mutase [Ruminococcaceae bacterium]|nr:phospho-sugar mutase [Oscillospiraceae bacterium]